MAKRSCSNLGEQTKQRSVDSIEVNTCVNKSVFFNDYDSFVQHTVEEGVSTLCRRRAVMNVKCENNLSKDVLDMLQCYHEIGVY